MRKSKQKAIARLEYEGVKIEVYNKHHLGTVLKQLVEATRTTGQISGTSNDEILLPTITQIVEAIQQLPNDMQHTHAELMMKLLNRKLASVGEERKLYDRFLKLVCAAHRIIETAQGGKFKPEIEVLTENGCVKKITVFRFVKKETAGDNGLPES